MAAHDNSSINPQWLIVSLFLACTPWPAVGLADEKNTYDVGVSVVDITPDYPIRLNGFGNRRAECEGVSQRIFAKALAISQHGQPPLVLVTLDSLGIRTTMVDEAAARLKVSHKLPRQNLAITFTHSHCTPKVNGACDNIFSSAIADDHQRHIDQYTDELTNDIVEAAQQALDSMQESQLAWATGQVTFAKNRRPNGGPVDHDLPMLVVSDAATGKLRAVYVSYACHCTTLSFNKINGDWAGYAVTMIERQVPGAVALVSIGAGSNQKPQSGVVADKVDVAEAQGVQIATEVRRLLDGKLRPITGTPKSVLNQIALPLNKLPTREELVEQTGKGRPTDQYNATTQLARLDRGDALLTKIAYPIQTWTFGDSLCMTFLAGEVCVDYSVRLKTELDRKRFWLNTYSNDFCSYIPSERLVQEGGYGGGSEVPYFALPATLKSGLEQLIIDEVHRQVPIPFHAAKGTQGVAPKPPQESLQCMTTNDGLQIQLVASEPNISDPVAIDFGPDGRLWVAEMADYGRGVYETFDQASRVKWLRDEDGDGFFETTKTFVDGLRFPTDVKVWRDGVLICDAPDILFAVDTDQDGVADSVTKMFSGFEVKNAQARVNSLRFGLDGWIYGSCGLFGGDIVCHKTGATVNCSNRDFRINPDTGVIQPISGRTQQGRSRNDWGDWFGCSNGTLLRAIPSDDAYLVRNPQVPLTSPNGLIADANAHQLFPPENLVTFELSGTPGKATSACGMDIYRDILLGDEYPGDAFTCEPVHQSVHRIDLSPAGHGFAGKRGAAEQDREFLSSTDRWFRPVQARSGPDGALWVVDMYRYVIEHSRWIPKATLDDVDVFAGMGRGRIYRVLPSNTERENVVPKLDSLSASELVELLNSPNGTVRDLVHQMLLWRSDDAFVPELRELIRSESSAIGAGHALSILITIGALDETDLLTTIAARDTELIRLSVQLSEPFLDQSSQLRNAVLQLAEHESPRVRRQVALSLGVLATKEAATTLVALLRRNQHDAFVHSAALNSVTAATVPDVLSGYLALKSGEQSDLIQRQLLQLAVSIGDEATVNTALSNMPPVKNSLQFAATFVSVLNSPDQRQKSASIRINDAVGKRMNNDFENAFRTVETADAKSSDETQLKIALLILGRPQGAGANRIQSMSKILSPRFSTTLQQAALDSMMSTAVPDAAETIAAACPSLSYELQTTAINGVLSLRNGPPTLLEAIQSGALQSAVLNASHRSQLLSSSDIDVRQLAEQLFAAGATTDRSTVVESMSAVLQLKGEAQQGRDVFRKRCSACHRLEDHGHVVGPDLRALTNRDPQWLLTAMLDPNKNVDGRYTSWSAATENGKTVSGMLAEETTTAIRLREAGGKEHIIPRVEIEEFRTSGKSVMPEGLERDMTAQDFRNVIAYLSSMFETKNIVDGPLPRRPPEIAPYLLDESQPVELREKVIHQRPGMGPTILSLLVADLETDNLQEEYRRMPWIWRVAIAVGKRNDGGEIRDTLQMCVPRNGEPLRHWQAVVIGGGLINGISQLGISPGLRMDEILNGLPQVRSSWPSALSRAAKMADDESVKAGTRYDALRMVALQSPETAVQHLQRHLTSDAERQLQMGAVSGLIDVETAEADRLLADAIPWLKARNRFLALEGMLRTDARAALLAQRVRSDRLSIEAAEAQQLTQHKVEKIRRRAIETFAATN